MAPKKLRVRFRRGPHREGQVYRDRTGPVKRIAALTRLRTFARVEHFLGALGKGHKG